jgi:hypothetical protein
MTRDQTLTALRFYQEKLSGWTPERCPADYDRVPGMGRMIKHALWMINDVLTRMEADDMDEGKAFRWLGFIQGALWASGLFTIDDMRLHNTTGPQTDE